jgi:hypothetical protein
VPKDTEEKAGVAAIPNIQPAMEEFVDEEEEEQQVA